MKNVRSFQKMKMTKDKIVMMTAYDYPSGKLVQEAQADLILVGDSLGMVIQGEKDTLKVTLDEIIYHTRITREGADESFIVADLPFMSYHLDMNSTKQNAARLITEAGADAVKLEGGKESRIAAIKAIVDCEIPVVAHLGLTPQSINAFGGYIVQGKEDKSYQQILEQAQNIEKAGAFMLVLECIPEMLGKEITERLSIPTIGIGAGRFTDGQVLVYHDILGMSDFKPKFVKQYNELNKLILQSLQNFVSDVKIKNFPKKENSYKPFVE